MLVEPPRSHLPPGLGLSAGAALRLGAAAAALVLAALSQGDAVVLAALLALAAWRPVPVVALGAALVASSWRWGATSLEALSGAQAVLGPAGWVGPTSAAAASWLAALAVVLAATRALPDPPSRWRPDGATGAPDAGGRPEVPEDGGMVGPLRALGAPNLLGAVVLAVAAGATAAAIVAGPAPGGAILARVVAGVVASTLALGVSLLRGRRERTALLLDAGAVVAAVAALATVAVDAGAWAGTISPDALREGVAVAVASGALAVVATVASAAMGARRA